jgi:membrane protein DedA with SNARE-associated domain
MLLSVHIGRSNFCGSTKYKAKYKFFPYLISQKKMFIKKVLFMDLQSFIENYGYAAILVGTFLEGETILILAGLAAHQGYLALTGVIFAGFAGSLCGDQLFFYLGRRHSQAVLSRRPSWKSKAEKVRKMMNRFQTPMILSFRFLYGLRTVAPFVIGMSPVSFKKFILFNAAGALVWAVAVGSGGYLFGHALEIFVGKIKHYEMQVFGMIALLGVFIWTVHFYHQKKHNS